MARIRTIKPEFWTDETVVQLPYPARLLFIGIWNFADDHGAVEESPDRLRMQIFPSDPALDTGELIDLLVASDLLERLQNDAGKRIVQVRNWHKHQKVDNPAKSRILGESYRKLAIPSEARRAVAIKYGCKPGDTKEVGCYFCEAPGQIHWWKRLDGRPSAWVVFPELELDHLEPQSVGGANSAENLVLSCRSCNRSRRDKQALPWMVSRSFASPIESSPSEGIKDQGKERILRHPVDNGDNGDNSSKGARHALNGAGALKPTEPEGKGRNGHPAATLPEAEEAWRVVIAQGPRTPRIHKALERIGGYQAIRMRTPFSEAKIKRDFLEAFEVA